MLVIILLSILGVFIGVRLVMFLISVLRLKAYWLQTPLVDNANFSLVTLGDSTMQGIGASSPEYTAVARIAEYITRKHSKKIHLVNISKSGARIQDVITQQLPHAPVAKADLIIISVGANDILHGMSLESFKKKYEQLLQRLPKDKVIVADVGLATYWRNRKISSKIWNPQLKAFFIVQGVRRAPVFERVMPMRFNPRLYAADFFHPSNFAHKICAETFEPLIDEMLNKAKPTPGL